MIEAEWGKAAQSGGSLPTDYIKYKFTSDLDISVEFGRAAVDYPDLESAIVEYGASVRIGLCRTLKIDYVGRVLTIVKLLEAYRETFGTTPRWRLRFALGDEGFDPDVICFSSNYEGAHLVPDTAFVCSQGYDPEIRSYPFAKSWDERIDKAYFRGTDSGVVKYAERMSAPRVAAAMLVKDLKEDFDVALSGVEGRADEVESRAVYTARGILAARDPQARILDYKYQIDIDGNTNAWSAFFLKLLSGSPVLKVTSDFGYRQWYYDRLVPWDNFVPVSRDLTDLVDSVARLKRDPTLAKQIGENGQALALSLDCQAEMKAAAVLIHRLGQSPRDA